MKKLIALCLSALILIGAISAFGVFADAAPTFVVSDAEGKPGDTVIVNVSVENNVGIVSMKLLVGYDPAALQLIEQAEKEFAGVSFGPITSNPVYINWDDSLSTTNNTSNGVVAQLTFKILDAAVIGKSNLTLTYDPDDVYDTNLDNVAFSAKDGSVNVIAETSSATTTPPATTAAPPMTSTETDPKETTTAPPATTTVPPATTTAPPITSTVTDPKESSTGNTFVTVTTVTETAPTETVTAIPTTSETETLPPATTRPWEDMVLLGDADLSDTVNIKDATLIQKTVAGLTELSARETVAANVISADILNVKDATAIQKWVASIPVDVSINEYVPYSEDEQTPSDPEETTIASDPEETTTESTPAPDDVATIYCGGATYTAKVGDTVTYTAMLRADQLFEDIQAYVNFDDAVLQPDTNGMEDVHEFAKTHCPNLIAPDNTFTGANLGADDTFVFFGTNPNFGYNFKSEKLLAAFQFTVLEAGDAEIGLDIDIMTIFGGENYYFDNGEAIVTDGIKITETIAVS